MKRLQHALYTKAESLLRLSVAATSEAMGNYVRADYEPVAIGSQLQKQHRDAFSHVRLCVVQRGVVDFLHLSGAELCVET